MAETDHCVLPVYIFLMLNLLKDITYVCIYMNSNISEGENNEEPIYKTTEVEILPSIDFCKLL